MGNVNCLLRKKDKWFGKILRYSQTCMSLKEVSIVIAFSGDYRWNFPFSMGLYYETIVLDISI